ncbi:unnamed protein product [Nippostrongylus brasiliensis]|uniref:CIA30 domain-containing protein n=1 Tax=Nippostrongylus brasiliensis TaxID=27835 RepID=A0A0N4XUV2_NIPBR|nr:unnamed protein product [Nippostrongylus brasiliensis]
MLHCHYLSTINSARMTEWEPYLGRISLSIPYYSGPRQCKFETNRYFVAVYETPVQYDIGNLQAEYRLASVDSRDPLGWKQAPFAETSEGDVNSVLLAFFKMQGPPLPLVR